MAAVSESLVREFFEWQGFYLRQQRKYVAPLQKEEEEIDFFVLNPNPRVTEGPRPFVLTPADLTSVTRAVVSVKGWHTETFSLAFLTSEPDLFRFAEPAVVESAARALGGSGPLLKILVVSSLPQNRGAREQSIEFLRGKGIDAVIPFPTILAELIAQVETNRNYQKSDALQVIRLLKNYDFLKEPQLELFKPPRKARPASSPPPTAVNEGLGGR